MTVLLHHLGASARLTWEVSATAELGALLAADLRNSRRGGATDDQRSPEEFRGLYEGLRSLLFYTGTDPDGSAGERAARPIAELSDAEFLRLWEMTVPSIDRGLMARAHADVRGVRSGLDDYLEDYVANRFLEHWEGTAPHLERHVEAALVASRTRSLAEAVVEFVGAARPGGSAESVLIEKIYDLTVDASTRPVRLIPTMLNWPQVLIKDEDRTVQIHYSMVPPGARPLVSSTQVTAQMAALSRQHSLAILREVAKRPIGTMDMAARLGIAPATVSRTLRDLVNASLITGHPSGRQRLYRLNVEEFEALGSNVWQVIAR